MHARLQPRTRLVMWLIGNYLVPQVPSERSIMHCVDHHVPMLPQERSKVVHDVLPMLGCSCLMCCVRLTPVRQLQVPDFAALRTGLDVPPQPAPRATQWLRPGAWSQAGRLFGQRHV